MPQESKKNLKLIPIFSGAFLLTILMYLFKPFGENFYILADIIPILYSLLSLIFAFQSYKLIGFKSIQGKSLFLIFMALLFWFLGELTWGVYEILIGIKSPSPSIADIFWLSGYPLFICSLYYLSKMISVRFEKFKTIIIFTLIFAISISIYKLTIPSLKEETTILEKVINNSYVIFDGILLISLILVIVGFSNSKFILSWGLIFLSILVILIADIYYNIYSEIYETGDIIDILWDLGYLLFSLGFIIYKRTFKNILMDKI